MNVLELLARIDLLGVAFGLGSLAALWVLWRVLRDNRDFGDITPPGSDKPKK